MGDTVLPPREAAKYICDSCDYVNILPEGIKAVSQKVQNVKQLTETLSPKINCKIVVFNWYFSYLT